MKAITAWAELLLYFPKAGTGVIKYGKNEITVQFDKRE
jgi:hypothetical protein